MSRASDRQGTASKNVLFEIRNILDGWVLEAKETNGNGLPKEIARLWRVALRAVIEDGKRRKG